ncbi:aspartyl-phosphate phosphatase Spo0E family protein [Paenibacillus aurantius]|uniref:Aspartyl-phosphate phosphatase Spo0E family protein n=1 Tax=Paenibacillus aurantius TaxID=2918900 RepID=A0AA96LG68_9BACL|nr:aspartyl-phosphate phosphatase Spo0E family protein [Paenibacillus aurantius]WJH32255.1 aspartyl-phosphate phosphatase Spo0E family protein [Paenibacillus sp. CC-CFT747]WNQ12634.1 aspartyl-phosphate phosphatase Spo0E family protein [Paenibacillus aurantius]
MTLLMERNQRINSEIELARQKMVHLTNELGFLHPDVVKCSENLDELLLEFYRMNRVEQRV